MRLHDGCMATKTPRPTPIYDSVCEDLGFSLENVVKASSNGYATRQAMTKRMRHKLAVRQNAIIAQAARKP